MQNVNTSTKISVNPEWHEGAVERVRRKILIDGRPLLDPEGGGVFEYTRRLTDHLLKNGSHDYHVWANAWKKELSVDSTGQIDTMTSWPNKLLHSSARFINKPRLDRLTDYEADVFWAPNPHFISLSSELPFALTIHDLSFVRYPEFFSTKQRLWHRTTSPKGLCKKASAILAVSKHTKRDLVEIYGIPDKKIHVTYEGCGEEYFESLGDKRLTEVSVRLGLPERFILQVGTLEPRKNHISTITAFNLIKQNSRYKELGLVIAGPRGWNNRDILSAVAESPYRDEIIILGFVEKKDKPAIYQLAEVMAFPSFYEGFGLPPLEAMASGTPVVASFSASLGEVVHDAGILIDPYRPVELAEALEAVLESPSLKAILAHKGRQRAQKFTWKTCAQKTAEIFANIC